MKNLKILKKTLFIISNTITFIISLFIPKTDKIIVVGGWFGKRFADNSKSFYLYANENKNQLNLKKVVWITRSDEILKELRSKGYEAYKAWSICSIWYHFRAKNHIVDQNLMDINPIFSVRSKRVNLWHGFPLKNIGTFMKDSHQVNKSKINKFVRFIQNVSVRGVWGSHFVLATSEFSAEILGQAFNFPKERVIISGYPRNYEAYMGKPLSFTPSNEKKFLDKIENSKVEGNKIIGYFPTFRDKRETLVFGTKDSNELKELFDYFLKLNIKVVGKFHFAGSNDSYEDLKGHESFINLPSDADVYTFLSKIDILITDYSSIYFDYLLWKKPIIFFPYDLEYYRDQDRGLIFNYEEFTPGPKVYNSKELKELFIDGIENFTTNYSNEYEDKALNLQRKIFGNIEEMNINHLIKQIKTI